MAYGLPRRNTVQTILKGSCYKVESGGEGSKTSSVRHAARPVENWLNKLMKFCLRQEPWDLAELTKTWYTNLTNIKLPFLGEIAFGSPMNLLATQIKQECQLPSLKTIALEKEYEAKRLAKLKYQENACKEIQVSLREKKVGLRRPLQPK